MRNSFSSLFLTLLCGAPLLAQGQDSLYQRQDSWAETMLASRARYLSLEEQPGIELGPWWATAPLPAADFSVALFPEWTIDLGSADADGEPRWTRRDGWSDGVAHGLAMRDHASTYLYRTITAAEAATVTARLGSDDGLAVWLNGAPVLSKDVARGLAVDQDKVALGLGAGENHLLLKIHNRSGGHGFAFSLRDDPLTPLWRRIAADFPLEAGRMQRNLPGGAHLRWFDEGPELPVSHELVRRLATQIGAPSGSVEAMLAGATGLDDRAVLDGYLELCEVQDALRELDGLNLPALRRAIEDLAASDPELADRGAARLRLIEQIESYLPAMRSRLLGGAPAAVKEIKLRIDGVQALRREALLDNPLLDFDRLLAVKRRADSPALGLPQNWQGNCSLPRDGYEDELVTLSLRGGAASVEPFFRPPTPRMLADVDLHFDADRMLFSMVDDAKKWQIWELGADGAGLRQLTESAHPAIDNYDACYLPDDRVIFDSTRVFQGIPCVGGADAVANLFLLDEKDDSLRQLCFDQDHDWCPTVLNDGRVLYARWEYSDTPHYFTRILFNMNPDGTGQAEYYGSNSFWPNSLFYARPIPGHPSQVVAIVSGHHGVPRMGELVVFDPAKGRFEADGVVQRIPGWGEKVEPVIKDQLVNDSWPRFLHPYPLSEKHFLVSCQPSAEDPWGIYLVDLFDNVLLLAEMEGHALFEPIPFRATTKPPVIPDRVDLARDDASVYLADVYAGPGLAGVPRGTVKDLRVYELHYAYPDMGGHKHVAVEGGWDVHRILGTVPVETDGSAAFQVPANTPLAVQPLDADGRAVQLMRSWFTAMPGETLSCVGCHESQNTTPAVRPTLATRQAPRAIEPWYGPARGFSFKREVQPVLDRSCVGCHDGSADESGRPMPDLRRKDENGWGNFTPSYLALHPYVRRPGPESDYHLQKPYEYHANTSELVQMLERGHYGVELGQEAWDRLVTWIDLNVPDHGTWGEHRGIAADYQLQRQEMLSCFANRPVDVEAELASGPAARPVVVIEPVLPQRPPAPPLGDAELAGWPFDAAAAAAKQAGSDLPRELSVELGGGLSMEFVLVPAGDFLMGDVAGHADELPRTRVAVAESFYLGRLEVTRGQYSRFDPEHDNGYLDQLHKDHTTPGYPANDPDFPVIRVSWLEAVAFCDWLSSRTGLACSLPSEAQWEWACRGGAATPFSFGDLDTDFGAWANLADASISLLAVTGVNPQPIANPSPFEDFLPKESRFDDGAKLMAEAGRYAANPWGLQDLHGNVWEWTRSRFAAYPYREDDGRNDTGGGGDRVVRGGSWNTRPMSARSASRLQYRPYQAVHDVGFRVMILAR